MQRCRYSTSPSGTIITGAGSHPPSRWRVSFASLPPPPNGASRIVVEAATRPQHTTGVSEQVTFTNPTNGLPTTAHIHLPYKGSDNGVYARTLYFYWDAWSTPGEHFVVTLNDAAEEERLLKQSIDYFTKVTGKKPVGSRTGGWAISPYTIGGSSSTIHPT